jgi:hypothetical protein
MRGVERMKSTWIVLALAIFISFFGCQSKKVSTFPDEVLGVWRTSAPKYQDCFVELAKNLIIFANLTAIDNIQINCIQEIEEIRKGKRLLYIIHYEDAKGQEYKFPLYYDPSKGGVIRFKNQQQIEWTKMDIPFLEKLFMPLE